MIAAAPPSTDQPDAAVPPVAAGPGSSRPATLGIFVLLAVVCASVFGNGLNNGFVFDDYDLVVEQSQIRSLSNLPEIFGLENAPRRYRPVRTASYALDHALFGSQPQGFRAMNIAYHAVCAFLVFLIIRQISGSFRLGVITALLFAVHPIQTDAVTYISGRRDVLSTLFYLLAFYGFLRQRNGGTAWWFGLVFVSFVLGLFTKEMVVTLPALMLIYDSYKALDSNVLDDDGHRPFVRTAAAALWQALVRYKWLYGPIFALALLFVINKVFIHNPSRITGLWGDGWVLHAHTIVRIIAHYMALLVMPVTLIADYSYKTVEVSRLLGDPAAIVSLLLLLTLFAGILHALKRRHLSGFAGLWFFVTLLPVSQIVPHHEMMAEHYLYLPSVGFCLAVALAIDWLFARPRGTVLAGSVCGLLLAGYSARSIVRNLDWKDSMTLYNRTLEVAPRNVRVRINRATALMKQRDFKGAAKDLHFARLVDPNNSGVRQKLGLLYQRAGRPQQAIDAFRQAVEKNPKSAEALYGLGQMYGQTGQIDEAIKAFEAITRIRRLHRRAHRELGTAYYQQKRYEKARHHYEKSLIRMTERKLRSRPKMTVVYRNLGLTYDSLGEPERAIAAYSTFLRYHPNDAKAHGLIANLILRQSTGHRRAVPHLKALLHLQPNNPRSEMIRSTIKSLTNGKTP